LESYKTEVKELIRQFDQADARNKQLEDEVVDIRNELKDNRAFTQQRLELKETEAGKRALQKIKRE